MRIGELAGLAGVSTRTVRHYHRIGLLPEPRRRENGYRSYELRDLVLLLRARRLIDVSPNDPAVTDIAARAREFGPAIAAMQPPELQSVDADPQALLAAVSAGMSPAQARCLRLMFPHWKEDMR